MDYGYWILFDIRVKFCNIFYTDSNVFYIAKKNSSSKYGFPFKYV